MTVKPKLSFWQIWNMSFGFLGIQMGFALQNANGSRILQIFGADIHELSWFWLVAPVTGMIVQPLIGHFSDKTWTKLGRRRPYFLAGAIMAAVGLILLPRADLFIAFLPALWVGAGFLMIMDASFNIAMEPFRALVADKLPSAQRTMGFSIQTVLIGIGAVVGSWLPWVLTNWMGMDNTAVVGKVPLNLIIAFGAGAAVLLVTIIFTVLTTKEYSPEEVESFEPDAPEEVDESKGVLNIFTDFKNMPKTMRQLGLVQFFSWFALFSMWVYSTPSLTINKYDTSVSPSEFVSINKIIEDAEIEDEKKGKFLDKLTQSKELGLIKDGYYLDVNVASFISDSILDESSLLVRLKKEPSFKWNDEYEEIYLSRQDEEKNNDKSLSVEMLNNIKDIGFVKNEFGEHVSLISSSRRVIKEHGNAGDWVGIIFGVYNLISAIYAFFLPGIAKRIGRKNTHKLSLIIGGIGLISVYFVSDPLWLIGSMVLVGFAWASILAMPYAILAGSIPPRKMGVYMGIFNFFIVFPQIVNAIFGGPIVKFVYGGNPMMAILVAGVFMILGAFSMGRVEDVDA